MKIWRGSVSGWRGILLAFCLVIPVLAQSPPGSPVKVIRAGQLIDTRNGRVLNQQTIIIEGGLIRAVGDESRDSGGGRGDRSLRNDGPAGINRQPHPSDRAVG